MILFLFIVCLIVLLLIIFPSKEMYGLRYIENFFSEEDFRRIKNECLKLKDKLKKEKNSIAVGRIGTTLPEEHPISQICNSEETLKNLKLPKDVLPSDTPVEYRVYPKGGQMEWHKDTVLYTKPQYEMVYTVDNTSDSQTLWYDTKKNKVNALKTKPNSMIIVKADDVQHAVSEVTTGERSILKFAYTPTLEKKSDYYNNLPEY